MHGFFCFCFFITQPSTTRLEHGVEDEDDEEGERDVEALGPQRSPADPVADPVLAQQHDVQGGVGVQHGPELLEAGDEQQVARPHVGRDDDEEDEEEAEEGVPGAREDGGQHGDALVVAQDLQQTDGEDEDQTGQNGAVDIVPQHGKGEVHVHLGSKKKPTGALSAPGPFYFILSTMEKCLITWTLRYSGSLISTEAYHRR